MLLVERESELAVVEELVVSAAAGRGGSVLVEGEAGIGKTQLLERSRAWAAARGARVLFTTADEGEAAVPLAVARALLGRAAAGLEVAGPASLGLRALGGGLAEAAGPGSRADEVVHALWWLIVELADERPLVTCVDDAQWADELSLRLLRLMARRASELPLALVVAARPASPGEPHGMLLAERAFVRVEPAPLSPAGTARLLEDVLGRPGSVEEVADARALTGGNPLYLAELLHEAHRHDGEPLIAGDHAPPRLVTLVADRLGRLPNRAAALARAIAILARDADPRRARALAELGAIEALEAEDRLRAERVLDQHRYAFTHPVVAAATRDSLSGAQAAVLHERAAALLAAEGFDAEHVAEHVMHAPPRGDPAAVVTLRRAAEAARRVGAPARAARLLERARIEGPPPGDVERVELELGRALLDAGEAEGEMVLGRLVDSAADASVRADAARQLSRRLGLTTRATQAVAVLRRVLDSLDAERDRELRLELLGELGCTGASDLATHQDAARLIAAEAARCEGRTPGERFVSAVARMISGDNPSDAADAASGARDLLALRIHRDYPGGFALGSLTFWAMSTLINADALDDARAAMDALQKDAETMAIPLLISGAMYQRAQVAYQRGDLSDCEREARAAIEIGGDFGRRQATPWLVMAFSEQDRHDEAQALLAAAGMLGTIAPSIVMAAALSSRGRLRLAQGDALSAIEDLSRALDRNAAWRQRRLEPPWRPLLIEALVLAGRTAQAAAEAEAYAERAVAWGTPRALGHAARARALVSPRKQSVALLEDARTHFAASPARLELARCLVELGSRRRAAGERRTARAILRDAHDAAHACGASALCRRARAELLLAGGRPRPPLKAGAASLTPAELRVAELAASGATNPEIARRLFLSPKTIEMHLRSAYRKLDLPGRDGLAAALDGSSVQG